MEQLWNTVVKAIADSGPIAIALIFVITGLWWVASGRGRVGSLVDKDQAEGAARYAKLEKERDDWKVLAQGTTPELKRLNDLLDTAVKLLLDRRPPA